MRPVRVLLVIVAVVAGLFIAGALMVPLLSRESEGTSEFTGERVTRVEISSERGAVTVRPGEPRLERRSTYILSAPDVDASVEAGILRVDVSCPGWAFVSCSADVVVTAPADAEVAVDAIRGNVLVERMDGVVEAASEDGSVTVTGGGSPRVTARSVTRPVVVETAGPPIRVEARSETEDVTVAVPPGAYRITAESAVGDERVEGLASEEDAPREIVARSGAGDVVVRAR